MKKILIINGHPDPESFAAGLFNAYKQGALTAGAEVKELVLYKLNFNPILQFGYRKRTQLEPDLLDAQQKILWAEHIVWIYPVWWGDMPALLKGFIDRVFLPGFAFNRRENSVWWDKLLTGRSAHIISTLDQPIWYYWLVNGRPTYHAMKKMTLEFSGFKPVKTTFFGPIRDSTIEYREKCLKKIENMGRRLE